MSDDNVYWVRASKARISRRSFTARAATAAAGGASLALVGCGDDDEDDATAGSTQPAATASTTQPAATASTTEAAPKRGGTFRFSLTGLAHLDIHQTSYAIVDQVSGLVYNRLLRPSVKDNLPEPDLALTMPEQPDQTTYVFTIPPNVKFHDRSPVNGRILKAQDVVVSLERARTPQPTFIHAGELRAVDKIEAVDDTTIRVTTKSPSVALLSTLSLPPYIVFAPEVLDNLPDLKAPEATIGTGPFMIDRWARDTGGTFVRHPNYFREGMPYLDAVTQLVIPVDAWSQFLAGNLDYVGVPGEELETFASKHKDLPSTETGGHYTAIGRICNLTRPPFKDERARIAIGLLGDRQKSASFQFFGLGRPSIAFGRDHDAWNLSEAETVKLPGFRADKTEDIKRAIELLGQAGYTKDKPLTFECVAWATPNRAFGNPALEFLKQDLEQSSGGLVKVSLKPMEFGTWKDVEARGQFDMTAAYYFAGLDPDHVLSRMHRSDGGRNYGRYTDPALDAQLDQMNQTFDQGDRHKRVEEIQRYIAEKMPISWMSAGPSLNTWNSKFKNFVGDSNQFWQLQQVWLDA